MVYAVVVVFDGFDVLHVEFETALIQGFVQPADPFHLAFMLYYVIVVNMMYPHPVAPLVFGDKTRRVGGAQGGHQILAVAIDRHQTDTHPYGEGFVLPYKAKILHHIQQLFGDVGGAFQLTSLQDEAEFIATQACQGIAFADLPEQQLRHLFQ